MHKRCRAIPNGLKLGSLPSEEEGIIQDGFEEEGIIQDGFWEGLNKQI
jgi:hypothetical protein